MKERCIMFHRTFPDKFICTTELRRVYAANRIRRHLVRRKKSLIVGGEQELARQTKDARNELQAAIDDGRKIIFIDQTFFTRLMFQRWVFANTSEGPRFQQEDFGKGGLVANAAISWENGLELVHFKEGSVDTSDHVRFLEALFKKRAGERLVLFFDRARVHTSPGSK